MQAEQDGAISLTFAELIDRFAAGVDRRDRHFARTTAKTLHVTSDRVKLPLISRLGLTDVVCTLVLDRTVRLVVTGWIDGGSGEVTVRYEERDFPVVPVVLRTTDDEKVDAVNAITWCTLDFSVRGRSSRLTRPTQGHAAGDEVKLLARSTVGQLEQYRVSAGGKEFTVAYDAVV